MKPEVGDEETGAAASARRGGAERTLSQKFWPVHAAGPQLKPVLLAATLTYAIGRGRTQLCD